jgi:DNA-binding HxlR family transcriptional regulator
LSICFLSTVAVVYSLTKHGKSLEPLIGQIVTWGQIHRKVVLE